MYPCHYLVLKRHLSTSFGTKFDNLLQPESQNILNQWLLTFYDYRRTGRALIWYQSDAMGCKCKKISWHSSKSDDGYAQPKIQQTKIAVRKI